MTTKVEAWRHPLLLGRVVLPDGSTLDEREARSKGHTVTDWPQDQMTATPHPTERHLVTLPRGPSVARFGAVRAGFGIGAPAPFFQGKSWRAEIFALPETKGREAAVAELLATQTENTMPVASARAFLRGLPTERSEEQTTVTTKADPRAARMAEIAANMKAFNSQNGYKRRAKNAAAPALASIDPARLKRYAEIRLNALEGDTATPVAADEAKRLRYALNVHAQTGMPLANVFAELRVDTSKFIRA